MGKKGEYIKSERSSNPLPGPRWKTKITGKDGRVKTGVGDSKRESYKKAEKAFPKKMK